MNPEELDSEWRRLVADGNDTAIGMEATLQRAAEAYELALQGLRDLARMSLAEPKAIGRSSIVRPSPSADADV